MGRGKKMKVKTFILIFVLMFCGCATNTKVEIEPGESVKLIIVEPKKEVPKERWDWKAREKLRKEQKEVEK